MLSNTRLYPKVYVDRTMYKRERRGQFVKAKLKERKRKEKMYLFFFLLWKKLGQSWLLLFLETRMDEGKSYCCLGDRFGLIVLNNTM